MTNFFLEIQHKFKEKYEGRYLADILEAIAITHPEVVHPIIEKAPLKKKNGHKKPEISVLKEFLYQKNPGSDDDKKRADLRIQIDSSAEIVIEIKIDDGFLDGQIEKYIKWARKREENGEDRAVVILTAHPLDLRIKDIIDQNKAFVCHMYISDFSERLKNLGLNSELIQIFIGYLSDKGYSMYKLPADDTSDYKSLLSFMVLNFLPHNPGHNKVATIERIANGPIIFSSIVKNWQIVSHRLAAKYKKRVPTIRYFPEQGIAIANHDEPQTPSYPLSSENMLSTRRKMREGKTWGRYWFTADFTFKHEDIEYYLEWGQILEIKINDNKSGEEPIKCGLYALIRKGTVNQISHSNVHWLDNGVRDKSLYEPEEFINLLNDLINKLEKKSGIRINSQHDHHKR